MSVHALVRVPDEEDLPVYLTRYEKRVELVRNVLTENSAMSDQEGHSLAVLVLNKLDSIPEKIR